MTLFTVLPLEIHCEISRYLNAEDCKSVSQTAAILRESYLSFSCENVFIWHSSITDVEHAQNSVGTSLASYRHRFVPIATFFFPLKYSWFDNQSVRLLTIPKELIFQKPSFSGPLQLTFNDYKSLRQVKISSLMSNYRRARESVLGSVLWSKLFKAVISPKNLLFQFSQLNLNLEEEWNSAFSLDESISVDNFILSISEEENRRTHREFTTLPTDSFVLQHIKRVTIADNVPERLTGLLLKGLQQWPRTQEIVYHFSIPDPDEDRVRVPLPLLELHTLTFSSVKVFRLIVKYSENLQSGGTTIRQPLALPQVTHIHLTSIGRDTIDILRIFSVNNLQRFEVSMDPRLFRGNCFPEGISLSLVTQLNLEYFWYVGSPLARAMPKFVNIKHFVLSPKETFMDWGKSDVYLTAVRDKYLSLLHDGCIREDTGTREAFTRMALEEIIRTKFQDTSSNKDLFLSQGVADILVLLVLDPLEALNNLECSHSLIIHETTLVQACIYELIFANIEKYFQKLDYLMVHTPSGGFLPVSYASHHLLYSRGADKNSTLQQMMLMTTLTGQNSLLATWQLPIYPYRVTHVSLSPYKTLNALYDVKKKRKFEPSLNSLTQLPRDLQRAGQHVEPNSNYMQPYEKLKDKDFCGWM